MRIQPLPFPIRLAVGYTGFFAVVLIVLTVGILLTVRQVLRDELERHLQTSAQLINADFDTRNVPLQNFFDSSSFLLRALPPSVAGLDTPGLYAQAVSPEGVVVAASASLENNLIPLDTTLHAAALAGQPQVVETYVDGSAALMLVRPLTDDQRPRGVLMIARSTGEIERTLTAVGWSLAVVSVIALVAAAQGGIWLTQRALRPVDEVARTARQIVYASDLARRVPQATSDDAMAELTGTINELLARLEQLFTAQQRFVADVSHELRTPLTAMRSTLEVLRRGAAADPKMLSESLTDLEAEALRLGRMANDLVLLARADLGVQMVRQRVALDELVLEVTRELHSLAGGVRLVPVFAEQIELEGDRDRLKQALLNLVVNALQHTAPGGTVWLMLSRSSDAVHLTVRDTGAGIPPVDLPHIFERFYRVDPDRSRATGGAGLGLSIARWVAEAHGGSIVVESVIGEGSTFTLHLPASPGLTLPPCADCNARAAPSHV
jgi:signal transduction histidine kinase